MGLEAVPGAALPSLSPLRSTAPSSARRVAVLRVAGGLAGLALGLFSIAGCTPEIGDRCVLSTDCSIRGDRLCDTSQPGGYCTQFNCSPGSCADDATCVLFNAALPGCGLDDRDGRGGSRIARSFCVAECSSDADCRAGYMCADARMQPWNGTVLEGNQNRLGCLVRPLEGDGDGGPVTSSAEPPPVCSPVGPDVPEIDASAPSIGEQGDAGVDGGDAGVDGGDAAADGGDAGDGG
jgi:hypothetical protein